MTSFLVFWKEGQLVAAYVSSVAKNETTRSDLFPNNKAEGDFPALQTDTRRTLVGDTSAVANNTAIGDIAPSVSVIEQHHF